MSEDKRGKGRPRKVDTAKNIQVVNDQKELDDNLKNHDLNTDIPDNDNLSSSSINENDDDLKSFIKNDDKIKKPLSNGITTDNDIDDELDQEIQDFENQEGLNDIPEETYNPLKDPVKQRGYTDGSMGLGNDNNANPNGENVVYSQGEGEGKGHEKVISEPNYVGGGHAKKPDIDAALINPSNSGGEGVLDIPDDYNSNNNNQNQTNKSNNNNVSNSGSNTAKSEKKADSNLKELSPKEKRESVEKDADAILLAYRHYVPMGFTYFSSHDIKKLRKLEEKGEIDLNTVINKKGDSILDYIKDYNKEVEEAFRITDAEIEMIKPALVDVLMEQEIAFTPTQRLIFVLGQFLVAKVMLLIKFIRQKNEDIKEFKRMHLENLERQDTIIRQNEEIRRQNEEILRMRKQNQEPMNDGSNLRVVKEEDIKANNTTTTTNNSNVTTTNTPNNTEVESNNDSNKMPTLDDALATNVTEVVENENRESDIPSRESDIPN